MHGIVKVLTHLQIKPFVNGLWMGLQTCAAPSANGLCTVRHKPKFVSFLCEHKWNCVRRVDRFLKRWLASHGFANDELLQNAVTG